MLINEIESINFIQKNSGPFESMHLKWITFLRKSETGPKLEGKIGPYQVFSILTQFLGETNLLINLFDTKKDESAGFVDLLSYGSSGRTWHVEYVGVSEKYQGQGLAVALYAFLVRQMNLILMSGHLQSPGGRDIWEKLGRVSGIFIFGYNTSTKTSFQIEQNDLFNTDIYSADLNQDVVDLEDELEVLCSNTDENSADDNYFKKKQELERKIRILANELYFVRNQVVLVAIKSKRK
jgi:GNAT superfamily N-acetyltransferase